MDDDALADEDKALFREHMRGIEPLKTNNKQRINTVKKTSPPYRKKLKEEASSSSENKIFLSDYISEPVESNSVLSYKTSSLSHQRFNDLEKGRIAWKSRLDLHGLTTDAARDALNQFIKTQMDKGVNCILIVHGKGGHQGEQPVLKNKVNRWLPQYPQVLAFHSAQMKDGGHGAVYVLLKKLREDL